MPLKAGSAIRQNAGKLSNIDEWSPCENERRWLLIAGSSEPPKEVKTSERRKREPAHANSGEFLYGISNDFRNLERKLGHTLWNKIQNLQMTKSEAESHIKKFFKFCKADKFKPMLFYTGHGEMPTGNWVFYDGVISIEEIFNWVPEACEYPTICSDACYSGAWANYCINKRVDGFECLSACREFQSAIDHSEHGGELTLYMTGNAHKLTDGRPATEPLFSRGDHKQFPTLREYSKMHYKDVIEYYSQKNKNMLICQSINSRHIRTVFAEHKKYGNRKKKFWSSSSYNDMSQELEQYYEMGFKIFSLACDQTTGEFFVYMVEGYGTSQRTMQTNDPDSLNLPDSCSVTSCTVYNSTYYFVVTGGVEEFEGKYQEIITRQSRSVLDREINRQKKGGMIMTSICYNVDAEKYLVVMTESNHTQQEHAWFNDENKQTEWSIDMVQENNLVETILFEDPLDRNLLCVMTCDDNTNGHSTISASLYDLDITFRSQLSSNLI